MLLVLKKGRYNYIPSQVPQGNEKCLLDNIHYRTFYNRIYCTSNK